MLCMDFELPGFGQLDSLMEIGCVGVVCTRVAASGAGLGSSHRFDTVGTFSEVCKTLCVNDGVVGHAHLSRQQLLSARAEGDVLRGFFEWIRRLQQASAVPVVIVAHNAFVTEGPHLMRACARAGLSFLDEMTSLGCVSLMDTMYVARCVPWKQIPKKGDTRIVIGTGDSAVGAGVALTELWKRAPKTAGAALATRADTVEEGDVVVLESVAAGEKDRLGLQVIYNHLLGEEFPRVPPSPARQPGTCACGMSPHGLAERRGQACCARMERVEEAR